MILKTEIKPSFLQLFTLYMFPSKMIYTFMWCLPIEFKLSMPSNCMDMANNSFLCLCTINLLSETIHEIISKMYSVNPFIHQLMQSMCWLSLWILVVQISCNRYKLIFLFPFEERKLGLVKLTILNNSEWYKKHNTKSTCRNL